VSRVGIVIASLMTLTVSLGISLLSTAWSSVDITLALKYVEFLDADEPEILNQDGVNKILKEINSIYSACSIQFRLDDYKAIEPTSVGLSINPGSVNEMWTFRKPFGDSRYLVVIKTGKWDHKKIGNPNAWTAMPGESLLGVVIESPVASFAGILAHELGHYLDLHHVENEENLMNPLIYRRSIQLSAEQCFKMRNTAVSVHSAALRAKNS
jgi:hypothetical protein